MIETKVTCDGCDEEIDTTTNYMSEAYIEMSPVFKSGKSSMRWATNGPVPIKRTYQFHNINCVGRFYHEKV